MNERLDKAIADKFDRVTTPELVRRMERAEDFGYDDEEYELNRRLGEQGLRWAWEGEEIGTARPQTCEKCGSRDGIACKKCKGENRWSLS